jgi:predicted helicase
VQTFVHELRYPRRRDAARLAKEMKKRHDASHMSVVYATYHSIDVVHRAQHEHGLPPSTSSICDEAHRTTGAKFEGEDESDFVRVHDAAYLRAKKRLYMTATPRIYGDMAKATAERDNVALCSMDDETPLRPPALRHHVLGGGEARPAGRLQGHRALRRGAHVSRRIQRLAQGREQQLRTDDAAKIIGCWKALVQARARGRGTRRTR